MGNKHANKKEKSDDKDMILNDAYKNTDIEFSSNELINLKLRIRDAENYFRSKFEIFYYFNNFIFKEKLYYLYENFNHKIESFSKNKYLTKNFNILIDFEDESLLITQGIKIDFESLFAIIFERLEISIVLFFYMTNVDSQYISDFFSQMIESADLFKYNRKFDCLYFLFANLDYFIKNDSSILYISNKPIDDIDIFYNDEIFLIENEYSNAVFKSKEKLITPRYSKTEAHNYIEHLLDQILPTYSRIYTSLNFSTEIENFILENEDQLKLIEYIVDVCPMNLIEIELTEWMDVKIFELFVKKIILFVDKSTIRENVFCLKIVLRNKNTDLFNSLKYKLGTIQKYLKNIIKDLFKYNQIHNKRKFVIELFEISSDNQIETSITNRINNNENKTDRKTKREMNKNYYEYLFIYEKLLFTWFIPRTHNKSEEMKKNLSIIIYNENFIKLRNKRIIDNLLEFITPCYRMNYRHKTKKISKFELQEILK